MKKPCNLTVPRKKEEKKTSTLSETVETCRNGNKWDILNKMQMHFVCGHSFDIQIFTGPDENTTKTTATTTVMMTKQTIIEQRVRHLINQNYLPVDKIENEMWKPSRNLIHATCMYNVHMVVLDRRSVGEWPRTHYNCQKKNETKRNKTKPKEQIQCEYFCFRWVGRILQT